ncbi:MAG: 50S ribosomal protein L18 [Bacteroidetes bacterium]|nr:50S ribosomal protein L18 [Bacteroidota bacterium]
MAIKSLKEYRRNRIKNRIRKVLNGTAERPRMTVFRSNKQIYVQLIDDLNGTTLASASSKVKSLSEKAVAKTEQAKLVGALIAERAAEAGIQTVVFDRNGYLYHGRVKALAEAAREKGLKF